MEDSRLTLLPDQLFTPLRPALLGRLALVGQSITAENFGSVLDETMKYVIQEAINGSGGTEGSVWLFDQASESLIIAYNTGPNSQKLAGQFKQPLSSGIVSMVFSSEQPFAKNEVFNDPGQDKTLDSLLKVRTYAMIAVPFYFLEACRGVLSCVQLVPADAENIKLSGFDENHDRAFRHAASILGSLIDHWAIRKTIGLD